MSDVASGWDANTGTFQKPDQAIQKMTEQPVWTEAEHNEIMRLHIIDGLIIDDAMREVFDRRPAAAIDPPAVQQQEAANERDDELER